jgi:hypothetical protein
MLGITTELLKKGMNDTTSGSSWNRSGNINQLGVNYRWSSIVFDEENEQHGRTVKKGDQSCYDVESNGVLQAGDRAPDATGLTKINEDVGNRLFKIFQPERHTVLIFADKVDYKSAIAGLEEYPKSVVHRVVISKSGHGVFVVADGIDCDVFEDRDGYAHKAYKVTEASGIYVVRPDGVVGARVSGSDGFRRYFQGILA